MQSDTESRNRIRFFREAQDLSYADVTSRLRVTERTVRRWEAGQAVPDKQKFALADLFGVSVVFLMGWEGDNGNGERASEAA